MKSVGLNIFTRLCYHYVNYVRIRVFSDHKVTIKKAKFFVLIVSCLRTHQRKNLQWTTNVKVFNTMVSHDWISPCCYNWLARICFCVCICLLPRIFYLACYRLWVERLLAFHSRIFPDKDTIYNTVFIWENTGQRKPTFRHILHSIYLTNILRASKRHWSFFL